MKKRLLFLLLASCASGPTASELKVLTAVLETKEGATVADIGAGQGQVAVALAREVGPRGSVLASELDPVRRRQILATAASAGVNNMVVVAASEEETGLVAGCCDSIVMRGVFHHLTEPASTLAGVSAALKPGGRFVVVDFAPSAWLALWPSAPAHGGHGIESAAVIAEGERAGFEHLSTIERYPALWPLNPYAVVFRKRVAP